MFFSYFQGLTSPWWWEKKIIRQMQDWSGFFPANEIKMQEFCELMLQDISKVDILGSWLYDEIIIKSELILSKKVHLRLLEP